jgi:WD40 repeat protein
MDLKKIVAFFSVLFIQSTCWCEKYSVREVPNVTAIQQEEGSYCIDSNKNNTLVIGGHNGTISIITETKNSQTQSPWALCGIKSVYETYKDTIAIIALSHDAARIASASFNNTIKIWHLKKQNENTITLTCENQIIAIAWNPCPKFDNRIIATASKHSLEIWDIKNPEKPIIQQLFDDEICSICWHSEGKRLVVGLYNTEDGTILGNPIINGQLIKGRLVLFNVSINIINNVYNIYTEAENKRDYVMRPAFLFFKNNETFLCGELGGYIRQHTIHDKDLSAGKPFTMENEKEKALVCNIAYNATTDTTAAFCQEYCFFNNRPRYKNSIRFWKNNIFVAKFPLKTNDISGMAFCHEGKHLAYVSGNGSIHMLEIKKTNF